MRNINARTRPCLTRVYTKRHITLIEMLITISIIAIIAGAVGINIRRALVDQRFRSETAHVADTLRLAQDLTLILGTDTHVKFKQGKQGIEYWMQVENGLSKEGKKLLQRPPKTLKAIHSVFFHDERFPFSPGEVDIRFLSGGFVMSRGVLYLSTHENAQETSAERRAICLFGYPHPITVSTDADNACTKENDEAFVEQLTDETVREAGTNA